MPRALIVDDLPENLYFLEVLLKGHGYTVQTAANGAEALALARDLPPDIVVTDIMMPVMDGFALCREWKNDETLRDIPLVVYTATYTSDADRKLALGLGADQFLIKPMEPSMFLREVEATLEGRSGREAVDENARRLSEHEYLAEHNLALTTKLEKKVGQLESAVRALDERESFLRAVLASLATHILVLDEQGMVVMASRSGPGSPGASSELTPETFLARSDPGRGAGRLGEFLGCVGRADAASDCEDWSGCGSRDLDGALRRAVTDGRGERDLEVRLEFGLPAGSEQRWFAANVEALALGGRKYAVLALQDITERKQAEEDRERLQAQLVQAQRLEAIGRLAGGVAHDFNNLLQAMMSLAQLLRLDTGVEELPAITAEMEAVIKRGSALTRQLLLFSRRQGAEKQPVELGEVVSGAVTLLKRLLPEHITLVIDTPARPLWVDGNAGQLQQVLMNLVVNAKDAMPDGGVLTVRATSGVEVCLEVADTGHGMDAATGEHIFEPFFTTKEPGKGTGLGLAVVHGIVRDHGGRIEVESAPGTGSRFRIWLPVLTPPTPAVAGTSAVETLPPGNGLRVLLVEDEKGVREGLGKLLASAGYEVTVTTSGEEATARAAELRPELLIADLILPGMTGPQLTESLMSRWPGMHAILMSGYTEDEALRRDIDEGRVRFLQKPFDTAALAFHLDAVRRARSRP